MYKILVNKEFNKLVTVHECLDGCDLKFSENIYTPFEGSIPKCLEWLGNKGIEISEEEFLNFGKEEIE